MAAKAPVTERIEARMINMPIVTIQITREGTDAGAKAATPEQKAALIKGASQLLLDVLNKPLEATFVVIDEVDTDNWGWGGLPVLEYRKKLARDRTAAAR
jgi:4-oxalocrotonate tautomerase